MVLVHEFGHFAVAKLCGVRVEVFSIGFGKRVCGFKRGDTDYRISLLPLGGYVKMTGENPNEEHTGDPGEFTAHPRWQRILIGLAGTLGLVIAMHQKAATGHLPAPSTAPATLAAAPVPAPPPPSNPVPEPEPPPPVVVVPPPAPAPPTEDPTKKALAHLSRQEAEERAAAEQAGRLGPMLPQELSEARRIFLEDLAAR